MRLIDMSGRTFGQLTVVVQDGLDEHGQAMWLCRCACGNERRIAGGKLRRREHVSCGCGRRGPHPARRIHGAASGGEITPEYRAWSNMIDRCERPENKSFKDYGGRGIRVCDRWRRSFSAFLEDVGPRPAPGYSIDRMNNHGGYEPGNCHWATREHQARNKRTNIRITINSRTMTMAEWARENGLKLPTVSQRIKAGWNPILAVTEPARHVS